MVRKSTKNKYYDSSGKPLPGVTTVLSVLSKPALIEWAWKLGKEGIDYKKVRDTRAGIGTLVHDMIECELKGLELDPKKLEKLSPEDIKIALKCKEGWDKWYGEQKKRADFEILGVELVMTSEKMGCGGTCDLYYRAGDKYVLMDIKTSKACYDEHKIQQCPYKLMLEEQGKRVDEIKLFQLNEAQTGIIHIPASLIPAYTKIFLGALEVYKAQKAVDIILKRTQEKAAKFKRKPQLERTRIKIKPL